MLRHIRIVSPSGAIEPEYIKGAMERLLSLGFEVTVSPHAYGRSGRFAARDDERLADLNEALQDPRVDAILCSRGGYGLQRIIDRVVAVHKPIIGFSDITALHQLSAISSQPSVHSIMCKHLATLPQQSEAFRRTIELLRGAPLRYELPSHPLNRTGEITAPLIGGNLSVLYGLQGTPFEIKNLKLKIKNCNQRPILLIEDICERHYHIDRMMNNLRLSGVLEHLSGLVVGQFTDCEDDPLMGETVLETIARYAAPYDYPVVFDAPVGHVAHNLPLWLNRPTKLTVTNDYVQIVQDND
ncbi:MAG: LD-carboxypeptidase [Paludibacteraceae bacterium]|nr:LD-carboxypeptidase [Paludibacteraceae bacterium]